MIYWGEKDEKTKKNIYTLKYKNMNIIRLLVIVLSCFCISDIFADSNKPFVIPELKEWKGGNGYFEISNKSRIVYDENNLELKMIAETFANDIWQMFKIRMKTVTGKSSTGDFVLSLNKIGRASCRERV